MGSSGSRTITCPHCCTTSPQPTTQNPHQCSRCHGVLPATRSSSNSMWSSSSTEPLRSTSPELDYVHLAPFDYSLDANLPDDMKEDGVIQHLQEHVIAPHFLRHSEVLHPGSTIQMFDIDFKILSCYPPGGTPAARTEFILTDDDGILRRLRTDDLRRIQILPMASTIAEAPSDDRIKSIFQEHVIRDPPRHLSLGEVFEADGIQFRVMACEPMNGHCNGESTRFFWRGPPDSVEDLNRVTLRPVLESLPQDQRQLPPIEIQRRYLLPDLMGRYRCVTKGTDLNVNGLRFFVEDAEPELGAITARTVLQTGDPLMAADVERQQIAWDEEVARRIQQEENVHIIPPTIFRALDGRMREDFRQPNSELFALLAQLRNMQPRGMPQQTLDQLPTFQYHETPHAPTSATDDGDEENDDHSSCRICLMDYEEGDVLRLLPCFHKYHRDCIDQWLRRSSTKCPICKTDVQQYTRGGGAP